MHHRTARAIAAGIRDANEPAGRPLPVLTDLGNVSREMKADDEQPESRTETPAPAPTQRWVA